MKLSFSLKNKEASLEADVEGLVKNGLEHKSQKTRYQIKQEEKRKNDEIKHKQFLQGMLLMIGLLIVLIGICFVCSALGFE